MPEAAAWHLPSQVRSRSPDGQTVVDAVAVVVEREVAVARWAAAVAAVEAAEAVVVEIVVELVVVVALVGRLSWARSAVAADSTGQCSLVGPAPSWL